MAAEEILDAAILQLRAKSLETFGIIKDLSKQDTHEGHADKVTNAALRLAQLEGGLITLQQYQSVLLEYAKTPIVEEEPPEEVPPEDHVITPEQSPTLRRSLEK